MPPAMFGACGDVTSTTASTPAAGVPPLQFAPFDQSFEVAPVQSVARAGDDAQISATAVEASSAVFLIELAGSLAPCEKSGLPSQTGRPN